MASSTAPGRGVEIEPVASQSRRWRIPTLGPRGSAPRRIALSMIDQCFSSGSNFLVGIVVARFGGPSALGAYSVAYASWLVLAAVHRAIVTDPMSIENDAHRHDSVERFGAGLAAELSLGVIVGALMAAVSVLLIILGMAEVGVALLTLSLFMPFLLVQDYWRWTGFMHARPGRALANDTVFNTVQVALLIALVAAGYRNVSVAIIAWGLGAVAGACFGLRQFSVRVQTRGGYAMVASRWHVSRWLLWSGVSGWAGSQAYPFVAGPFVGAAGLGGLKAAQSLVAGPSLVLLQAGGSVGLPEASHGLEHSGLAHLRHVARLITLTTVLAIGLVAAIVMVAAPQLLGWIYGSEFVQYAGSARIMAVGWVVTSMSVGSILILKVTRNTRELFRISIINVFVLVAGILILSGPLGVNGTAWAMLFAWTISFVLFTRAGSMTLREYASDHPEPARDPAPSAPDVANDVQDDA